MGIVTDGIIRPTVWSLEKLGLTHRFVNAFAARHHRRTVAKNPFRTYVPTSHDVFVAAYVKSGTNWMMQIAHQLVNHGRGAYEHIHSVVPWPDTALMGPMRHYAIPVEDPLSYSIPRSNVRSTTTSDPSSNGWDLTSRMTNFAMCHGPANASDWISAAVP